jgi:hypothetical protein
VNKACVHGHDILYHLRPFLRPRSLDLSRPRLRLRLGRRRNAGSAIAQKTGRPRHTRGRHNRPRVWRSPRSPVTLTLTGDTRAGAHFCQTATVSGHSDRRPWQTRTPGRGPVGLRAGRSCAQMHVIALKCTLLRALRPNARYCVQCAHIARNAPIGTLRADGCLEYTAEGGRFADYHIFFNNYHIIFNNGGRTHRRLLKGDLSEADNH